MRMHSKQDTVASKFFLEGVGVLGLALCTEKRASVPVVYIHMLLKVSDHVKLPSGVRTSPV